MDWRNKNPRRGLLLTGVASCLWPQARADNRSLDLKVVLVAHEKAEQEQRCCAARLQDSLGNRIDRA